MLHNTDLGLLYCVVPYRTSIVMIMYGIYDTNRLDQIYPAVYRRLIHEDMVLSFLRFFAVYTQQI